MLAVKTHVYDVSTFLLIAEEVKSAAMKEIIQKKKVVHGK